MLHRASYRYDHRPAHTEDSSPLLAIPDRIVAGPVRAA